MALDEFAFIEQVRRAVAASPGVAIGIGDDCAAIDLPPGEQLLVSKDLLLEGVHFRREWTSLFDLGAKAAAVNLSDLAAMGAKPAYLVLGLGFPASMSEADCRDLVDGFLAEAAASGVTLIGGDTCRAQQFLTLSVTAFGTSDARTVVRRSGAGAGDLVFVSGTLGDSALALHQLLSGRTPVPELARRHHRPSARLDLGRQLAAVGVSAMIDISDGLLADLGHLLKASAVGAEITTAALPLSVAFQRQMAQDPDLLRFALAGGEDYELLFTLPEEQVAGAQRAAAVCQVPICEIGCIVAEREALWLVDDSGRHPAPQERGFSHFSNGEEQATP